MFIISHGLAAVSYTHLDVYKRQALRSVQPAHTVYPVHLTGSDKRLRFPGLPVRVWYLSRQEHLLILPQSFLHFLRKARCVHHIRFHLRDDVLHRGHDCRHVPRHGHRLPVHGCGCVRGCPQMCIRDRIYAGSLLSAWHISSSIKSSTLF